MQQKITPVIICGGSGTRLWPMSRSQAPKQFLEKLYGSFSLFQLTIKRLINLNTEYLKISEFILVTNEEYRFLVVRQLEEMSISSFKIILEPTAKNTAPALTLAALEAQIDEPETLLLCLPADHVIKNESSFAESVNKGLKVGLLNSFVIFGIPPDRADAGFGYIEHSSGQSTLGNYNVIKFVEKPSLDKAEAYVLQSNFKWNSGMFLFKAKLWFDALSKFKPDILDLTTKSFDERTYDNFFIRPSEEYFNQIVGESIDHAILEQHPNLPFNLSMVLMDADWSDLGSWQSFWAISEKNINNNVFVGDVVSIDTTNSLAVSTSRLISLVGLDDLVVVETSDAILITSMKKSQNVKDIVNLLSLNFRPEVNTNPKTIRPWGWFDIIDIGDTFKVKRIGVSPGASLSLQKHNHRAEHWVVVKGLAKIECDGEVKELNRNESTFIPKGKLHRLSNPTSEPLVIIEIQSGDYLGEDDIERFDDIYGRI